MYVSQGFPGGSDGKEFACNVGDQGSIPGQGRSLGEEKDNPLLWTEEPGGLQSMGSQKSSRLKQTVATSFVTYEDE